MSTASARSSSRASTLSLLARSRSTRRKRWRRPRGPASCRHPQKPSRSSAKCRGGNLLPPNREYPSGPCRLGTRASRRNQARRPDPAFRTRSSRRA
jgi:hypothetical protein